MQSSMPLFVCGELGIKELGDRLKVLGLELLARRNKLVAIVLGEQHIEPLKC
jgi:hypothetical protein